MNYGIYELEGLAEALHHINSSPGAGTSPPGEHHAVPEGALAREGGPSPERRKTVKKVELFTFPKETMEALEKAADGYKSIAQVLTQDPDTRPWCWGQVGSGYPFRGPFASRELAIDDAESELDKGESFTLGRCNMIRPEDYVQDDLDYHLESMQEALHDDCHEFDNDIFEVAKKEEELARASLSRHLKAWARRWVSAGDAFLVGEEEEVTLGG